MTKRRATDDSLGGLHEVLADSYAKYLADVKSGAVEPDPRMMKEIREFLKDNSIEAIPEQVANKFNATLLEISTEDVDQALYGN